LNKIYKEDYSCQYSYLEVQENSNSVGRFCGHTKESKPILGSGSFKLKLRFSQNDSNILSNELKTRGFWLEISSSPVRQNIEIKCNHYESSTISPSNTTPDIDLNVKLKELQKLLNRTISENMIEIIKKILSEIIMIQLNDQTSGSVLSSHKKATPDKLDLAIKAFQNEIEKEGNLDWNLNGLEDESEKQWRIVMNSVRAGLNLDENFKITELLSNQTHQNNGKFSSGLCILNKIFLN